MKTTQGFLDEIMSTPEKRRHTRRGIEDHQKGFSWICENYEFLLKKYRNEFVAVYVDKVIAYGKTIPILQSNIPEQYKNLGVSVQFIYEKKSGPSFIIWD